MVGNKWSFFTINTKKQVTRGMFSHSPRRAIVNSPFRIDSQLWKPVNCLTFNLINEIGFEILPEARILHQN